MAAVVVAAAAIVIKQNIFIIVSLKIRVPKFCKNVFLIKIHSFHLISYGTNRISVVWLHSVQKSSLEPINYAKWGRLVYSGHQHTSQLTYCVQVT